MQTIEEWRILRAMGLPGPTRPGRTHTFHEPEWPNLGRFWHHSSGTLKVSVRLPHVLLRCNVVDYDVGRSILRWSRADYVVGRSFVLLALTRSISNVPQYLSYYHYIIIYCLIIYYYYIE